MGVFIVQFTIIIFFGAGGCLPIWHGVGGLATNSPTNSTIIKLVTWLSGLEVHGGLRSSKTIAVSGSAVSTQSCRHLVDELMGRIECAASGSRAKK